MRYWGGDDAGRKRGSKNMKRRSVSGRKRMARPGATTTVAGGSVRPFLRRLYSHQAVVGKPIQRLVLLLAIAGLIYAFVLGDSGAIRIAVLRHDRAELDRQIAELDRNAERLQAEIERLQNDPFYIEKTARERYGYVRPDERVYRIVRERKDK